MGVYSSVKGFSPPQSVHDQLGHQVYQMRGILLGRLSSGNQVAGSIETLGEGRAQAIKKIPDR